MKNSASYLLIFIFLVTITAPLIVMKSTEDAKISFIEKRRLAVKPSLPDGLAEFSTYPERYEIYFNDHFGFRSELIHLYNSFFVQLFHTSANPAIIVGDNKWLFFAGESVIEDFMGEVPLGANKQQHWKQILLDREEWLADQGIHYLLLLPPNKIQVYPEHLPKRYREQAGTTNLERFLRHLKKTPQFKSVLDLRPVLAAAKAKEQLYLKGDTHWNFDGSYAAYEAIVHHLQHWFPEIVPVPKSSMTRVGKDLFGDLTLHLNLADLYAEKTSILHVPDHENSINYKALTSYQPVATENQSFRKGKITFNENPDQQRKAIFISDSFGSALRDYLTQHFKRIVYVRDARFEDIVDLIREEKPDVVIDLNVARGMHVAMGENVEVRKYIQDKHAETSETIFALNNNQLEQHIARTVNLDHLEKPAPFSFRATTADPQIFFNLPKELTDRTIRIQCQLSSPRDTMIRIFYQTPSQKFYDDKKCATALIRRGQNFISLRIYEPFFLDTLRFDPGEYVGKYRLEKFTVARE